MSTLCQILADKIENKNHERLIKNHVQNLQELYIYVYFFVCLSFIDSETTGPIFTKFCTHIELSRKSNIGWVTTL